MASLSFLGNVFVSVTVFSFRVILSGVTLFVELYRDELSYMPGDKTAMSLGVVDLEFYGVVALGVPV